MSNPSINTVMPIGELKEIAKQMGGTGIVSTDESWSDASFTASFSVGPSGGKLEGNITYWDGKVIYFESVKISHKDGTGAGAAALPIIRAVDYNQMPDSGEFVIEGFALLPATLTLTSNGSNLTRPHGLPFASAGVFGYSMKGTVRFIKR